MWTRVGARHFEVENDGVEHFGGTATLRKLTQGGICDGDIRIET